MSYQILRNIFKSFWNQRPPSPEEKDIEACYELGRKIAKALPA